MRATIEPSAPERQRTPLGRRGLAVLLALAIELLVVLLLLTLAQGTVPKKPPIPTIFGFNVDHGDSAETKSRTKAKAQPKGGAGARAPQQSLPKPIVPPPLPSEAVPPANVVWLSKRDYSAASLPTTRSPPGETASDQGTDAGSAGDSPLAGGHGPHGEPLYAADWYRRPTNAELYTYIPDRMRGSEGWGEIACRTIDNYRVEDCQELGESPRGSGLAGAVRQAAWQFRVKPPRVGGKWLVGSWVSIRIDYTIIGRN